MTQGLGERFVRDVEFLVASSPQHDRPPFVRGAYDFGDKASLSDARLARHQHCAPRAFEGFLPRRDQSLELVDTARELERGIGFDERGQRELVAPDGALPNDLTSRECFRKALEFQRPQGSQLEICTRTGECTHQIARQDLAAGRRRTQP